MRVCEDGVYRDATEEEVRTLLELSTWHTPTIEDRVTDLESAFEALLSGRTE